MFKNVAGQKVALFEFDYTTGAPKTGDASNISGYVDKDWAGLNVLGTAAPTEIDATNAKGWYVFTLTQAETNANELLFSGKSSTGNTTVVGREISTFPANLTATVIDSSGNVNGNLINIAGSAVAASTAQLGVNVVNFGGNAGTFSGGIPAVNPSQINGDATAAANLAKTTRAIGRGTVASAATTTSIPTSAFAPSGAATDQFKGRIVTFDATTATSALQGQATDITGSTNASNPTLTVTALTTAPSSGDSFSIT